MGGNSLRATAKKWYAGGGGRLRMVSRASTPWGFIAPSERGMDLDELEEWLRGRVSAENCPRSGSEGAPPPGKGHVDPGFRT